MSDTNDTTPSLAVASSRYQFQVTTIVVPAGQWTSLCNADVRRWALRLVQWSVATGGLFFSPVSGKGTPAYATPPPNSLEIKWRDYPSQCGAQWFAFSSTGCSVTVFEEIFLG